jgi:hypothetical protein
MMMTKFESLIEELVTDMAPAKPMSHALAWVLVAAGAALMLAVVILKLKLRYDLAQFQFTLPLLWKLSTTLGLAAVLTHLVLSAAQPQYRIRSTQLIPALFLACAFVVPGLVAWVADGAPNPALFGYKTCLITISSLGAVQLAGILLWLRQGAPTHAAQAGFLAGIASGGWASFAYSVYCLHDQIFYAATWYTLATLALGGIGALLAPRVCKW